MSNIDKQWLQQKIAEMEAARDDIPFGLDDDDSNTLAALRIALSSLEAEAVAEVCEGFTLRYIGYGPAPKSGVHIGDKLYTAPPSPVSVPDAISTRQAIAKMENHEPCDSINVAYKFGWNACRAAMLQGADGNSPAIPNGWVLVPVEPTEQMIMEAGPNCPDAYEYLRGAYKDMTAAAPNHSGTSDGWVACSDQNPEKGRWLTLFGKRTKENCDPYVDEGYLGSDGEF